MFSPRLTTLLVAVLATVILPFSAIAGDTEWKPISPEDIAAKEPKVEKDADAEAIFWEVRIDDSDSSDLALNHYVRVKVFTERGREKFSKIDVPFAKGMKIKDIFARVVKADGTIVELKKEDIFEREIIKAGGIKIKAKSFAVPNIEPGVIVEYRYREILRDEGAVGMRLAFQREIPVQNLSYYYKPYNKNEPNYQTFNMTDVKFVKDQKGYYLAQKTNVPSFKEEPLMPPADQVRPWLLLQSFRIALTDVDAFGGFSFVIKDPSSPNRYWSAVGTERAGIAKLLNKPSGDIKKAAEEIAAGAASPEEKLKKIYEFCQAQIKNTNYDFSLTDEQRKNLPKIKSPADVLKNKSANAAWINFLFGSLAGALGFETRMAYAGNRSEMFFSPEMTNESFIHMAAVAVNTGNNEWRFFDPGTPYLSFGMLQWHDEGVWALLVGEKQFSWLKTPMSAPEKSVEKRTGKFKLAEDGTLEGDVRIEYTGQLAVTRKFENDEDSPTRREENLKDEIKAQMSAAEISNITVETSADSSKPFVYAFKVKVPGYATRTGKRLFLQPGFFEYGKNPVFPNAKRTNEVYFYYPWSEDDKIEIELPAGFALDSADVPAAVTDPNGISRNEVKMQVTTDGKTLLYQRKFKFGGGGHLLFPVGAYGAVKNLFDAFHKNDTHAITLKQQN